MQRYGAAPVFCIKLLNEFFHSRRIVLNLCFASSSKMGQALFF